MISGNSIMTWISKILFSNGGRGFSELCEEVCVVNHGVGGGVRPIAAPDEARWLYGVGVVQESSCEGCQGLPAPRDDIALSVLNL